MIVLITWIEYVYQGGYDMILFRFDRGWLYESGIPQRAGENGGGQGTTCSQGSPIDCH